MFTCKQVSKSLAKQDYETLPWHRKLGLKLHVVLCLICGRYNRQVMLMQDTCRHYKANEEKALEKHEGMPASRKAALEAALKEHIGKTGNQP